MDLQIRGKTAVVTGGTRGIGRAIVETFVTEGADVAFCARNADEVVETEKAFANGSNKVVGTVLDVRDGPGVSAWVDSVAAKFGGLDMVVSNVSALAVPDTEESWAESFRIDIMGTFHLVKAAIPYLEKSTAASIVAISSTSGREADFAAGPYGSMKAAVINYMAGLASRLAKTGIRVNTVSPGNVYFQGGIWPAIEEQNPELFSAVMELNPTGRMGTPQEVATSVVFLSSPVSSRTTGTNLLIDGALTRGIQF
jgi:NAD(P)-dependent dehydrogenase (short-subunit alcohol dehydrogenase family)